MLKIAFDKGSLIIQADNECDLELIQELIKYDKRIKRHRARACDYEAILRRIHGKVDYEDRARTYQKRDFLMENPFAPRQHQADAFAAWTTNRGRGLVVLPTGSGKSFLAMMAISHVKRDALIIAPTLDLVFQWAKQLEGAFRQPIGILGGGHKEVEAITVSTYDSALLMMEFIGDKFGLLIYDECHHLPGERNRMSAIMSIAPYRMGLTATPERNDGGEEVIFSLLGPLVYRQDIDEMQGNVLAPYETHCLELPLSDEEALAYEEHRGRYLGFVRSHGINFSREGAWGQFVSTCARTAEGRDVFRSYREQKRIANSSSAKLEMLWQLFKQHQDERIIVFTNDNATAYEIGRLFVMPVLTHHTKPKERKEFLQFFREGHYPVLITSKVLNEGVDVPEASVGIVVSGTGSTREHVQRLGRILRQSKGKKANLYELISQGTSEFNTSERRREHRAYQRRS